MIWAIVAGVYGVMSLITAAAFWSDKRRASRGLRRTRESTLHLLELLGGWPGALLARPVLRHKTRDVRFLAISYTIIGAHAAAWGAAMWLA